MKYTYGCKNDHEFEHVCSMNDKPETLPCPECGEVAKGLIMGAPMLMTNVVPSYPGCKKVKAGYVHSHGDKAATKVSSGFGGCVNPKTSAEDPIVNGVMPEAPKNPKPRLAS